MLCDCCKKEESVIQISGVGHFCMKCHNDRMRKHFEKQDDFRYRIQDASEPILAEDELLMQVKVSKKQLTEELLEKIK